MIKKFHLLCAIYLILFSGCVNNASNISPTDETSSSAFNASTQELNAEDLALWENEILPFLKDNEWYSVRAENKHTSLAIDETCYTITPPTDIPATITSPSETLSREYFIKNISKGTAGGDPDYTYYSISAYYLDPITDAREVPRDFTISLRVYDSDINHYDLFGIRYTAEIEFYTYYGEYSYPVGQLDKVFYAGVKQADHPDTYRGILEQTTELWGSEQTSSYSDYVFYREYTVFDMDNDGVDELMVQSSFGYPGWYLYTMKDDKAVYLGEINDHQAVLSKGKDGVLRLTGKQGARHLSIITIEDDRLVTRIVADYYENESLYELGISTGVGFTYESEPFKTAKVTDFSLLR